MARIAGVNVPDNKHTEIALTAILVSAELQPRKFVMLLALQLQQR